MHAEAYTWALWWQHLRTGASSRRFYITLPVLFKLLCHRCLSWESGKSDAVCKLSVLINIFISAELIQCGGWVFLSVTEAVAVLMI